jgi:hypothetical protein
MLDSPVTVQGSVTVASPVQVTGTVDVTQPVRMVSADSDPTRHVQITNDGGTDVALIAGPFFLTDVSWSSISTQVEVEVYESTSSSCGSLGALHGISLQLANRVTSGMRYFIPEGRWLCGFAPNVTNLVVAGFRPY